MNTALPDVGDSIRSAESSKALLEAKAPFDVADTEDVASAAVSEPFAEWNCPNGEAAARRAAAASRCRRSRTALA